MSDDPTPADHPAGQPHPQDPPAESKFVAKRNITPPSDLDPNYDRPVPEDKRQAQRDAPQGLWRGWIRPLLTVIIIVTTLRSSLLDWNDVPTGSMVPTVAVGDRIVVNKLSYAFNLPFNGPVVTIPFINFSFDNPADFLPGFYYAKPKRSDIVTFWKPSMWDHHHNAALQNGMSETDAAVYADQRDDAGIRMVKRIVAIPGDTVEMRRATEKFDGRPFDFSKLIVNGEEAVYADKQGLELTETLLGDTRRIQYMRNTTVNDQAGNPRPFPVQRPAVEFGPVTLGEDQYLMIGDNRDNSADGRFFGPVHLKQITGKAKFVAVSFNGSYFKPNTSRFFHAFDRDVQPATPPE